MNQTDDADNRETRKDKVFFRGGFYWIASGAVILCAVVIWYSRVFSTLEGQYTFIGQNILNVLIIAAIVVQALIYRRQWDAMMGELHETRKLVAQSERAVIAAEQSANVARESFYTGDRAYVFLDRIYLDAPINTGKYPVVHLEFRNTGRTPALNCRILVSMAFLDNELREMAEKGVMPTSTEEPITSAAVIGAGAFTRMEMPDIGWESPEVKALTMSGEYTLYVWGEAVYLDIFERQHFSTFCVFPESTKSKIFSFSPHGNDIDKTECEDGAKPN